jgi:FKBP-type peptidyl-prolyl cis-trans isomerase
MNPKTLTFGGICIVAFAAVTLIVIASTTDMNAGQNTSQRSNNSYAPEPKKDEKSKDDKEVTTKSGLKYVELKVGDGDEAKAGTQVKVHYTGWLENGMKFDSSVDRGQAFGFKLGAGQVIKGWDEGVAGMKVGGKRKLIIPSELGYGKRGAGATIPPDSTLIFEVELLGVGQ